MTTAARATWFSRTFTFDLDLSTYPNIVERLRGTPARLEERVRGLDARTLTTRVGDRWSIQENVGHLLDLEVLWLRRLDDFECGAERLRPADLTNRATDEARHNSADLAQLLGRFRRERAAFVERLDAYDAAFIARTALHPRLAQPMRVLDHALFVAEHDDHHLATVTALLEELKAAR